MENMDSVAFFANIDKVLLTRKIKKCIQTGRDIGFANDNHVPLPARRVVMFGIKYKVVGDIYAGIYG